MINDLKILSSDFILTVDNNLSLKYKFKKKNKS